MERLTEKVFAFNGTSCMQIKDCGNDTCDETCRNRTGNEGCQGCPIQIAIDKLAEYEDLEEQGRLLKLPVAVGDTVYVLAECENIPTQLDGTLYGANGEPGTATGYYCPYEDNCPFDDEDFENCEKFKDKTAVFEDTVLFIACYENEICVVTEKCAVHSQVGEYIFLTRPEADRALAEMEGKK